MNNNEKIFLTPSQFTCTLISALIGIGFLYMPNSVIKAAKQDGWIGSLLGGIYPIYVIVVMNYLCKKHPNSDILTLSKRCFGNILGSILNYIYITFFLFVLTSELAGVNNLMNVYTTPFLKKYQIMLTILVPISYVVYKGIKTLGRINEVCFYLTIILLLLPIAVAKYGSYTNLMPIFSSGITNIINAAKETAFYYCGAEIIGLIYPFLNDKKQLLKCGIISTCVIVFTYTWLAVATIYYLGIDISPKYLWPVLALADSINVPIINSFRYVFVSLWLIVVIKCMTTYYFAVSYGLNKEIKKISMETITLILFPIVIYLSSLYGNPTTRRYYSGKLTTIYVVYNLVYISAVAILIRIKKR